MSTITTNPADVLDDREVKSYFLSILSSELTAEEKYSRFVEFFRVKAKLEEQLITTEMQRASAGVTEAGDRQPAVAPGSQELVAQAARDSGIWKPKGILKKTRESIELAVRRLLASRFPDGGWGFKGRSDCWGTAFAVHCLDEARHLSDLEIDVEEPVRSGLGWLRKHPQEWSVRKIPRGGSLSTYEVSVVIRCFRWAAPSLPAAARDNLDRLLEDQNGDGGWDASIWGADVRPRKRVNSEVGATTSALKALAAVGRRKFRPAAERAVAWLVRFQNPDGGWNDGSRRPGKTGLSLENGTVRATINKTCDGIQGILVARKLGLDFEVYRVQVERAIGWLQEKEKPILEGDRIRGWKWEGEGEDPFENTCLTLETLVQVPEAPLPMLVANADWLIRNQIRKQGDPRDGGWKQGDTARSALSLIRYYRTIAASPLFQEPAEVEERAKP